MIPVIDTARLRLRPMREADFPQYAATVMSDRAWAMGGPYGLKAAWGMFCHDVAGWGLFGMGALTIDRRDTGETLGQVQLNNGPLFPETELGWLLFDGHEGRGYATEAAAALRDWAFGEGGLDGLVSHVHPENRASARVAERLGGVPDRQARNRPGEEGFTVYRLRPGARAKAVA
jgi:RimJ/RimL family protein N-acetyltransferase